MASSTASRDIVSPCAAGARMLDRIERDEDDIKEICERQMKSDAALMAAIKEMGRDLSSRLDAMDKAAHARELAWQETTLKLEGKIAEVRSLADVRRAVIVAATSLALVVAAGAIAMLLKGCCW